MRVANGRPFRLSTIAGIAATVLTLLALIAAIGLIATTTQLAIDARSVERATEARLAGAELRTDLLAFGRASDLVLLRGERYEPARAQAESRMQARLRSLDHLLKGAGEREAVRRADSAIGAYVAVRKAAEVRDHSLSNVIQTASGALRDAEDAAEQVETASKAEADAGRAAVSRWDHGANMLATALALVLVLGTFAVLSGMHRLVYEPLQQLTRTIARFTSGTRTARAPNRGPPEIRTVSNAFNDLADHLDQENIRRFAFLAGVAHDLRTPLTTLRAGIGLIDQTRSVVPPERATQRRTLLSRQVDRLERMVGDFLDAASVEAGQLELHPQETDLGQVAEEIVDLYRSADAKHDFSLDKTELPVRAVCDRTRLEQVLQNLVSNAVKYSPRGGPVRVRVEAEDKTAIVSVTDQGIGIRQEDLSHIFEPFRRTGASRELIPGVGLGLSVSRKIIEAHGGTIDVESRTGVGSTFRVRIPRSAEGRAATARKGSWSHQPAQP